MSQNAATPRHDSLFRSTTEIKAAVGHYHGCLWRAVHRATRNAPQEQEDAFAVALTATWKAREAGAAEEIVYTIAYRKCLHYMRDKVPNPQHFGTQLRWQRMAGHRLAAVRVGRRRASLGSLHDPGKPAGARHREPAQDGSPFLSGRLDGFGSRGHAGLSPKRGVRSGRKGDQNDPGGAGSGRAGKGRALLGREASASEKL